MISEKLLRVFAIAFILGLRAASGLRSWFFHERRQTATEGIGEAVMEARHTSGVEAMG